MKEQDLLPKETRRAVFSEDRQYRYRLDIVWSEGMPLAQFIGLNPSTADEFNDDPTVRRCKQFAKNWGCGGMIMTNIFAFRSTDPQPMKRHPHPVEHPHEPAANNYHLIRAAQDSKYRVAAWGNHGTHKGRGYYVAEMLLTQKTPLQCFRLTGAGQPEHPLYQPYDRVLIAYAPILTTQAKGEK